MTHPAAALADAIAGYRVVTCDVFDTAVLRRLARPEDVHLATGARLVAGGLTVHPPDAFRAWRIAAEQATRRAAAAEGRDEPLLAEIYAYLAACGIVGDPIAAAECEVAAEIAACLPNPPVQVALAARAATQILAFVSDTVLPGAAIAALLAACGYGPACCVFTSADAGRSKHAGGLYAHVLAELGVAAEDVIHLGDNPHSDLRMARAAGIAAFALPPPARPPERADTAAHAPVLRLLHSHRRSALAAPPAGRFATLHRHVTLLAIGFALFILADARRRGITRIHFLARDGYLPLAIARRIVARTGEAFDLRYLDVSRQSVVVPTMAGDPALPAFAAHGCHGRPLATALNFLGVAEAATAARLRDIGLDPAQKVLGQPGMDATARLFEAAADLVAERIGQLAADATAYLGHAGFTDPGPRLIVDVGWNATTQSALARLTGRDPATVAGCYLGLLPAALRPGITPDTTACYLFGFGHPAPVMDMVMDGYALLEMFFSAPSTSVLHYEAGPSGPVPIHATEAEPGGAIRRAAFAAIEQGCLAEFDALDHLLGGAWPDAIDPASALADLAPLLTTPDAASVAEINTIPFLNGADGSSAITAIGRVPLRAFLRDPATVLQRAADNPWRAGWVRANLPAPFPSMTYATFADRARRVLGWRMQGG